MRAGRLPAWAAALHIVVLVAACDRPNPDAAALYASSADCGECHPGESQAWQGSLHAAAARQATPGTVAAAFDGHRLVEASAVATPYRSGDAFTLAVEDGGRTTQYPVPLVLGRGVLEQFLVSTVNGRLQAFPLAYDVTARTWVDVFPDAPSHEAWRHWENPGANANSQCLECHVTGFTKGFAAATDRYDTRWAELGVGCEGCHGPGATHVAAARAARGSPASLPPYRDWASRGESMDVCATCHARRIPIGDGYTPGAPLADHWDLELLDGDAFFPDGTLRGEAYEWTSFRMSRMERAGVVCQDCHEPHTGILHAQGNALCLRCHDARLDDPSHHHHASEAAGGACVGCHMPETVFMERDRRRDHAFTRPDPRRAEALGAPDPCTSCHAERDRAWARGWVAQWWGEGSDATRAQRALAVILHAARDDGLQTSAPLVELLGSDTDDVRRASVARFLVPFAGEPAVQTALQGAAHDASPWVRAAATRTLGEVSDVPGVRATLERAAGDPARVVRGEAAFALREVSAETLAPEARAPVARAHDEWLTAQEVLSEVPETHFNLGVYWTARGEPARAEAAYRQAIALWPADPTPRQNLAMLLADEGRTADATRELDAIVARDPAWPPARYALGLLAEQRQDWSAAIAQYEECVRAAPQYPGAALRLAHSYAAAGDTDKAAKAYDLATHDPESRAEALRALVRLAYDRGDEAEANRLLPEALLADPAMAAEPRVRDALGAP